MLEQKVDELTRIADEHLLQMDRIEHSFREHMSRESELLKKIDTAFGDFTSGIDDKITVALTTITRKG
jgi:hypothetical protein